MLISARSVRRARLTLLQKLKGDQDLANITKQGDIDISKIGATGSEEQVTRQCSENTMKDRKDQSNYAWFSQHVLMTTTTAKNSRSTYQW